MAYHSALQRVVLFGGRDGSNTRFADTWVMQFDSAKVVATGNGCGGGQVTGFPAQLPTIGNSQFGLSLSGSVALAPAAAILGGANPALPLDGFGAPGCTLLANNVATLALQVLANSEVRLHLPVPMDPRLRGLNLFTQFLVVSPAANQLGVVASDRVVIEIR